MEVSKHPLADWGPDGVIANDPYTYYFDFCLRKVPDFQFQYAVMGEAWMRENYTLNQLTRIKHERGFHEVW